MKILHSRGWVMFLLAVIFIAPSVLAYLYYQHPHWLSAASTNRGEFVTPIYRLQNVVKSKQWRLLYWAPSACDNACLQQLNRLARVRLALGRRLYQVDACLLLSNKTNTLSVVDTKTLQDEDVCVLKLPEQAQIDRKMLGDNPLFFIVNPENILILKYPDNVPADNIFHDIKHLITEPS